MKFTALLLFLVSSSFAVHYPPGTNLRPILSPQESIYFTKEKYLQGWKPPSLSTNHVDYSVDGGRYKTIQSAVNAAIRAGGTVRKYIRVKPGIYRQPVYIPNTNVPLTIYGAGRTSSDTVIVLKLQAQTTTEEYEHFIGPHFKPGDPAHSMYESCTKKGRQIGTGCTGAVWVTSHNVQLIKLTIQNTASTPGDCQAVALAIESDRVQVHDVRLLSRQDTLYIGSSDTKVQRSHFTQTYIEGDVDFVFGGGSAVFESCVFKVRSERKSNSGIIFAPSTNPHKEFGFLVLISRIEGDTPYYSSKSLILARAWDAGVASASNYVPGRDPNGQLVIRDTTIDGIIPINNPYTTATSGRKYSGNGASSRDLNNNNYNRFWEFNNHGEGA